MRGEPGLTTPSVSGALTGRLPASKLILKIVVPLTRLAGLKRVPQGRCVAAGGNEVASSYKLIGPGPRVRLGDWRRSHVRDWLSREEGLSLHFNHSGDRQSSRHHSRLREHSFAACP